MAVLLSANAYATLSQLDRARVDAESAKLLGYGGVSTVESRRFATWPFRAVTRGWAMARLGMGTQIPGVGWPAHFNRSWLMGGPNILVFAFRRLSSETEQVAQALRNIGATIPFPLPAEGSYEEALSGFLEHKPLPAEPWNPSVGA